MGQSHSSEGPREVSTEQLSHELALRFASKCFTHLEIAHFKDNFKTLADHQDDIEYWKEETVCQFLSLPEALHSGSVIYAMCTYLGAFPFPSLAPCILTREAMLKVVTIMTGKYRRVLKRGQQDKVKLLFRSLAVFDRRASVVSPLEKSTLDASRSITGEAADDLRMEKARSHVAGFSIDEPSNEDEEEDDDDLVLAALDALDAIEVFKHDQRADRKIHHAQIPVQNIKPLVMLLLMFATTGSQDNLAETAAMLDNSLQLALERSASAIIQTFDPEPASHGIHYRQFVKAVSNSLPFLFEPLGPVFDHFLFSKNIDLSKHRGGQTQTAGPFVPMNSPIVPSTGSGGSSILNDVILGQIATFHNLGSAAQSRFSDLRIHQIYSTTSHGTSLSSFSHQVLSWSSATLLLISGSLPDSNDIITLGAYLPEQWKESASSLASSDPASPKATMFQLGPRHAVFPANPYNKTKPVSYFSLRTGIALGCVIPAASRTNAAPAPPILGPVSLSIDADISMATFQHDGNAGSGSFLTDLGLEEAQRNLKEPVSGVLARKTEFGIDSLEVWGISVTNSSGEDELTKQKKRLEWEEAEAARRRGVNFGGDKDGARALLEMAGIVGDDANNRSGGSV